MATKNTVLIAGVHGVSGRCRRALGFPPRHAGLRVGVLLHTYACRRGSRQCRTCWTGTTCNESSERSVGSPISCSPLMSKSRLWRNDRVVGEIARTAGKLEGQQPLIRTPM